MKNKYLLIILLISSFFVNGQINTAEYYLKKGESIIYLDKGYNIITNKDNAEFYRIYKIGSNNESIGEINDYYKSGSLKLKIQSANYIDLNDNKKWRWQGKVVGYYDNGVKERELNWKDGKQNGSFITYYKSGEIKQSFNKKNDKNEGEYKSFYESGSIEEVRHYVDGLLQGEVIDYFESSEIKSTLNYINDLAEGEYKIYYESGKTEQIINFKKSVIVGTTKRYKESGKIENILEYENGKLVKQIFFYDNGGKKAVLDIVDDELNKVTSYNKLGGITKIENHYKSGDLKYVSNYLNGELDGESKAYFKSGKVAEKNVFSNGEFKSSIVFDKFGKEMYAYNDSNEVLYQPYKDEEIVEEIDNANYAYGNIFEGEMLNSKSTNFKVAIEDGLGQYMIYKNHKNRNDKGEVVFDGPSIEYYNFGQIKSKVNYINDKKHGVEEFYDRLGYVTNRIEWNNGVKDNWNLVCDIENNCEYVFESNFNDTESTEFEGWALYDNNTEWSFVTVDKDLMIKSKTDSGYLKSINLPISEQEDFQVSILTDWLNGADNKWYGLIIGWKDWDNFINLNITASGYYKVEINIKGLNVGMQDYEKFENINFRGNTKLNIVRVQEKLLFSINGKIIYSSEYSSLSGDEIGIYYSGEQTVNFDNFKAVKSNLSSIPNNNPYSEWAGNGSGVILTNDGYIATNNHVIENANDIEVEFNYQNEIKSFKAEVIIQDEINDLAIIRINDPLFDSLKSIPYNFKTRSSDVGESVFALGYPKALSIMGKDIKFTDGKISSKSGIMGDIKSYQTTTPIQPGNSGGPLFDYKGNLIAINSSKLTSDEIDNVSYSIKSIYLLTLIDALPEKVTLPSDTTISSMSLTNKIKVLSNYVVLIKVR